MTPFFETPLDSEEKIMNPQEKLDLLLSLIREFRTPVNAILGYAAIAKNHSEDAERMLDSLQKIGDSGEHLKKMLSGILKLYAPGGAGGNREALLCRLSGSFQTDALTGVKNRNAYAAMAAEMDEDIRLGNPKPFAIGVFDVNDLKSVNDTRGHEAGDQTIRKAAQQICNTFKHSPVYRIGGDEFAVLMQNSDFEQRGKLISAFREKCTQGGAAPVACGLSVYTAEDHSTDEVFARADQAMYQNKREMKGQ